MKKWVLIVLIIVLVIVVGGGAFFLGRWYSNRQKTIPSPSPTLLQNPSPTPTKTATPTPSPTQEGWKTFINDDYGYRLSYPEGASISYADENEAQTQGLTKKACVEIKTDVWYVVISASANKDGKIICGRTGVGSDYHESNDTIKIEGKTYDASGFELEYASAGNHEAFWVVRLDNETKIEYGVTTNDRYGEVKFEEAKTIVKKVVQSYQIL